LTTEERKLFPQGSVYGIGENNMVETDHGLVGRIQNKTRLFITYYSILDNVPHKTI
jgi:hypothetical protein